MVKSYEVYPECNRRAGTQRIALRTGDSANTNVKWLVGDHLGSTSVTADYAGTLISRTLYKPLHSIQGRLWGEVRYQSGARPTQYTYTGQYSHTADFGLMYYVARWHDPVLGRFAQADSLVPGAGNGNAGSMSQVANQMYTPLTTGYYESPVLAKLNTDNQIIQMYGGLLNMSEEDKQKANIIDVPLNVQGFDRYAYSLNNPLRYTDPTGHYTKGDHDFGYEIDGKKITLWYKGEKMVFEDIDKASDLVEQFIASYERYENNLTSAAFATGALVVGLLVFTSAAAATFPADGIPLVGQAKLAAEITLVTSGVELLLSGSATKYYFDQAAYERDTVAAELWETLTMEPVYLPIITNP